MEKKVKTKRFRKMLENGTVHFQYTKKDGTIREASGTRKIELIPENMQPKESTEKYVNLRYFDLNKNDWRSISGNIKEVKVL